MSGRTRACAGRAGAAPLLTRFVPFGPAPGPLLAAHGSAGEFAPVKLLGTRLGPGSRRYSPRPGTGGRRGAPHRRGAPPATGHWPVPANVTARRLRQTGRGSRAGRGTRATRRRPHRRRPDPPAGAGRGPPGRRSGPEALSGRTLRRRHHLGPGPVRAGSTDMPATRRHRRPSGSPGPSTGPPATGIGASAASSAPARGARRNWTPAASTEQTTGRLSRSRSRQPPSRRRSAMTASPSRACPLTSSDTSPRAWLAPR